MHLKKLVYILSSVFIGYGVSAQNLLTLEEAIKTGLEKNYDLLIVKNSKEIARLQNNIGNAGMSPQLSLNGNGLVSNLNSKQEFNNGTTQERNNAQSFSMQGSLNLDMMVYDGNKMFAIKKRLEQTEQLSALELKRQIENTIYAIITTYYNIVRINELIATEKQNLLIYAERKKIAQLKLSIGSDSKVDLLLSQSDENKAKSLITQMEFQLLDAKTELNKLMSMPADNDYLTVDTIEVNYNPSLEELKRDLPKNNSTLLIAKQNELLVGQTVKEARSAMLPYVSVGLDYRFIRSQSQAGFLFSNNQNGLFGGLTAGWVLYSGNKNRNFLKEKDIAVLNQKLITSRVEQEVDGLVYVNYQKFLLSKKIAELELLTLKDSQELQGITMERYRVGKTNLLETIEAQKNLEDAQYRYINALYSIKVAETELLRVNGSLLK